MSIYARMYEKLRTNCDYNDEISPSNVGIISDLKKLPPHRKSPHAGPATIEQSITKITTTMYFKNNLETLPMDNGWARFIIFLFGDPHLLEGGERGQDGATDPY